ncbi:MAG: bifunctional diaminohydroxyphosphoribosylaminopyrimidine deaminase/5-amino-6-(5-phosphoribosylamino)uracil reductase RibD [Spirochaetia bacterium]|nr:bifunctional diaminohydroxyphosphoribosylaminopyrimidine deaminase/5-amino-6-(5-phosphoribosylamino)uracil reductase RibD [Spirochaetia bacterium]
MKRPIDELYMQIAIELAKKAVGHTSPNPLVGCVMVKNGEVIATGRHKKAGSPHAEAEALDAAGCAAKGSTMYVNLEPCSHSNKRTPPCADAIIRAGVKEVVAAMKDPNKCVSGRGFNRLRRAGIKVTTGVMEEQAKYLNRFFTKNKKEDAPYIIMKAGISLDGRMALSNGVSQWITGKESRSHARQLRRQCDAIACGIGTVLKDNPYLDCRTDRTKKIKKVIFDTHGKTPLNANIFRAAAPQDVFIITSSMPGDKLAAFYKRGVNVIIQPRGKKEVIDLKATVAELYLRGICSIVVEGGAGLHASFLKERLYDEAWLYIAPMLIGSDGLPVAGQMGLTGLDKAITLNENTITRLGRDVLVRGAVKYV